MLDLNFVRDNLDLVNEKMRAARNSRCIAGFRIARSRAPPDADGGRGPQGAAQQGEQDRPEVKARQEDDPSSA